MLLNSDHFKQIISDLLSTSTNDGEDSTERIYVLQIILSIATNNDSQKAKLKASSMNRKIKDFVTVVKSTTMSQSPGSFLIIQLADSISDVLDC